MLTDTLIAEDGPHEAELEFPCVHLGPRTDLWAKGACASQRILPVYRCERYRLCSPFGDNVDRELIQPCRGGENPCPDYRKIR